MELDKPPVTLPVTIETPLTPAIASGLARELAIGLRPIEDILSTYKISSDTYEKLKTTPFFEKVIDTAKAEWNSAANTPNRLQLEAAYTAEQAMPIAYARAISGREPLNHVVEFLKWLSDLGGLKKDPQKGQQGEKFQITINLGADTRFEFEGSKQPLDALPIIEMDKQERV